MNKRYKIKTRCKNCNHADVHNIDFGKDIEECPTGVYIYVDEEGIRSFYNSQGQECTKAHYLICTNCGSSRLKKEFKNKK